MTGKQIETTPIRWGLVLFVHAEKTLSVAIRQPSPAGLIEELYRNADEVVAVLLAAREAQW